MKKFFPHSNLFEISSSYNQIKRNLELEINSTESKLVKRCKKGDAKAQYALYKRYCKGMYNVAMRLCNSKTLAEDVLQDAFIKAFSDIKKLKNDKAFGGWLKRIVINKSLDALRNNKLSFVDIETLQHQHFEIAEEIENTIEPEQVHAYIKKLPDGARQILVLRALEGYKHAEIGETLGVSESTVKTQYFRAKKLLAKMIRENETEHREIFEGATV